MSSSKAMNNEGINRLARVMQKRMQTVNDTPPLLDFGRIREDGALVTNSFGLPIPRGEYLVCRSLTLGGVGTVLTRTMEDQGTHGGHSDETNYGRHIHDVQVPPAMRGLQAGDAVLVAWVNESPVVIDIIHQAAEV